MVQLLQRLRRDRNNKQKAKDDERNNGKKSSNAPKQREGWKPKGGPTTTTVGASADKTTQKYQKKHQSLPRSALNDNTASSDPDLSLRLSTTQEDLLKDVSLYVKEHDVAPEIAAATASPSANTAATIPASPWIDTPVDAGSRPSSDGHYQITKTGASSSSRDVPNTSTSLLLPPNLVGTISAITVRGEEEVTGNDNGGDDDSVCSSEAVLHAGTGHRVSSSSAKTMAVVSPMDDGSDPQVARPRSLRNEFDSVSDSKILGDAGEFHGESEFARQNSATSDVVNAGAAAAVGGFSPLGEINGTRKKAIRASNNKTRTTDLSVGQDVSEYSYDDSYSFNESYAEEDGKVTLYDEIVDFLCCDLTVPTSSGARDGRGRSSVTTGRRRRDSPSRRHDRRRPPSGSGKRG